MKFGIETTYAGYRFRSRLEARWAAWFDFVKWSWQYEPIDLNGYIPDFIIDGVAPTLVEVKPALTFDELKDYRGKIIASGWDKAALIVGTRPLWKVKGIVEPWFGLMFWPQKPDRGYGAVVYRCPLCNKMTLATSVPMPWRGRICGHGSHAKVTRDDVLNIKYWWAEAANVTRWRPEKMDLVV